MKALSFLIINIISITTIICQTIDKLDEKNGFRDIKLGSSPKNYPFLEKLSSGNSYFYISNQPLGGSFNSDSNCKNCIDYVSSNIPESYSFVANSKIYEIKVNTYKDQIYEIILSIGADPYSNYTLLEFCSAFGEPNGFLKYGYKDDFTNTIKNDGLTWMDWESNLVQLRIMSINGSYKINGTKRLAYVIIYRSKSLSRIVDEEVKQNKPVEIKSIDKF